MLPERHEYGKRDEIEGIRVIQQDLHLRDKKLNWREILRKWSVFVD